MDDRPKDRNNESRAPLNDLYRLSTSVNRWSVVRTSRDQSVAEHSYHVALLAWRIGEVLGFDHHDLIRTLQFALIHDGLEAWTGDIAGPMHPHVDESHLPQEKMFGYWWPIIKEEGKHRAIVKIADLAESIKFLKMFGDNEHASQVLAKMRVTYDAYFQRASEWWDGTSYDYNWDAANKVVHDFLNGPETYIDDYLP